jgi:hypothetical protein
MRVKSLQLFLGILLCAGTAHAYGSDLKIRMCVAKENVNKAWGRNVAAQLGAISRHSVEYKGLEVDYTSDESPECRRESHFSCASKDKVVYCDEETLARVLHGIAWVSLGWASVALNEATKPKHTGSQKELPKELPFSFDKGVELADAHWDDPKNDGALLGVMISNTTKIDFGEYVASVMALVPEFHHFAIDVAVDPKKSMQWSKHRGFNNLVLAYGVYEVAVNDVLAFLVGHEMAHGAEKCAIDQASRVESSGIFADFLKLQSKGDLFCPNELLVDEVLADQCAYRLTDRIDSAMAAEKSRNAKLPAWFTEATLSVGRRVAIDTMTWLIYSGLANRSSKVVHWTKKDGSATIDDRKTESHATSQGYINAPLRIILFSALLNEAEAWNKNFVATCDFSAKVTVDLLRKDQMTCLPPFMTRSPKQRKLAGALGKYLPRGVAEGWLTNKWNEDQSYRCSR